MDLLRSFLPAGTLSGAPKVRAMEIIDELESVRRGLYGGAIGYIDFGGNMDFCITIRTMIKRKKMFIFRREPASLPTAIRHGNIRSAAIKCGLWPKY